jgi:diguanylate cyclase (GGDEF)-like protein
VGPASPVRSVMVSAAGGRGWGRSLFAQQRGSGRRVLVSRLITPLALFMVGATLLCALALTILVRQADDRYGQDRRRALQAAMADIRSGTHEADPALIRGLEQAWGLKDLRFETEPDLRERDSQPVLDQAGRIIGWFTWTADRRLSQAINGLGPLLLMLGVSLIVFCALALWLVRRSTRDLAISEQRAWKLAYEDLVTGLPNRRRILQLVDEAIAARQGQQVVMFAFVALEGFRDVSDALGQQTGDRLLSEVAIRLRAAFPLHAAVGRVDGDEFAIVMLSDDAASATSRAEDAVASITRPFWVDQAVHVGATIGLAFAPRDGATRDALMAHADLALRSAKRRGGVVGFEAAIGAEFNDRRFIERELRRALVEQTLDVHYQPIVTADGLRTVGVEALLRWNHPMRGNIPPATFVPIAEQAGIMEELGEFVLRRALADAARWPDLFIAVNLSPIQVRGSGLVDTVASVLAETGTAASRVVLEVTETVLAENPNEVKKQLDRLRALGVRIALDDFGTGYSSMSYLQRFPFDKLKIDRSFVEPLGRSSESGVMIQAMVTLGRALGLSVLAEGVETEEQRVLLRLAGCDELQGFLFAKPAPREAIDRLLASGGTLATRNFARGG